MGFEPQKFFIGLMDFFAILLPGGLVTFFLADAAGPWLLGHAYYELGGTAGWIAFLFAAYLVGHFIFLAGSYLLDDKIYDRIRRATPAQQFRQLAEGRAPASGFARWLAVLMFKPGDDVAVSAAARIKDHYLAPLNAKDAVNAFQWSKARLIDERSEAMATVQRLEADSKFFRSLCVVLAVFALFALRGARWDHLAMSLVLLGMSFWRYKDQRVKATSQAYWYVISAEAAREPGYRAPPPDGAPTRAGGVVYRGVGDAREYLLVRPSDKRKKEWVLPKGHVEAGERLAETAVREVREEAGVLARVVRRLDPLSFTVDGVVQTTELFLLEAMVTRLKTTERRDVEWFTKEQAVAAATHDATKAALVSAASG